MHLISLLGDAHRIIALSVGSKKSEQAAAGPKTFASQEDASKAVYDAAKAGDSKALLTIFGPDSKDLLFSGEAAQDQAAVSKFTASYDQKVARRRPGPL